MRLFTADDYQQLIDALPDTPENRTVLEALQQMRAETSVAKEPWTFEVDFSTGAGLLAGQFAAPGLGAQVTGSFLVDTSSPFMLVSQTYKADIAGAAQLSGTQVIPNATVFIQDQAGNRNWMNVAVPVASLFGTAQLPYFLPQPRLIPGNSTVNITLANYEAANTNNVRLSFHGYRLYAAQR